MWPERASASEVQLPAAKEHTVRALPAMEHTTMNTLLIRPGTLVRAGAAAVALAALCVSAPAFADGHGRGGGGGGGGRGGYSVSHGSIGGGSRGHSMAPSGGRMGMAPSRSGGFSGARPAAPTSRGGFVAAPRSGYSGPSRVYSSPRTGTSPRFSSSPRFDSSPRFNSPARSNGSPRFNSTPRFDSSGRSNRSPRFDSSSRFNGSSRVDSSPRFNSRPTYSRPSYSRPDRPIRSDYRHGSHHSIRWIGFNARPRYWAGGYFHGSYWPSSYYHSHFVRFVTVLPAFYSTFYFSGVPYYYWDSTYYTYSPSEYGYVATDPPPVVDDSDASDTGSAQVESSDSTSLYIYPKNGQSEEQTSNDRYECHQWAASQSGFDPTQGADQSAGSSGPSDYRRAMMACLDARGYSAR
jgi:hypothetical protein